MSISTASAPERAASFSVRITQASMLQPDPGEINPR